MGKKKNKVKATDHIERESKYLIGPGALPQVLDLIKSYVNKGELLIAGMRDIDIEDRYYDSNSFLLAANGLCLRLRTQPERPVKLTLKQEIENPRLNT